MVQILRLRTKYALGFVVVAGLTLSALPLLSRAKAKFARTPTSSTSAPSGPRKRSRVSINPSLAAEDLAQGSHANYNDFSAAANVNGYGHGATLVGTGYASLKDTGTGSGVSGSDAGSADHMLNGSLSENGTITVGANGQVLAALNRGGVSESGGNAFGRSGAAIASSMIDISESDLASSDDPSQGADSAAATSAANGIYGDPTSAAVSGSQEISSVSDQQLGSSAGTAIVTTDDSANVIVANTRGNTSSTSDGFGASRNAGEFTPYGADIATNGSNSGGGLNDSGNGSGTSGSGSAPAGGQLATISGTTYGSGSGGGLLAVNTGGSQGSGGPFAGGGAGGGITGTGTSSGGRPGSGDKLEPVGGGDIYNGPTGQPTSSPSGDPLGATAAPEPGVIVTALSLVAMTGLGLVRGRRRTQRG